MSYAVGDVVEVLGRDGVWRVHDVVGGPLEPVYRLQRDGWRWRDGYEATAAELVPTAEVERAYAVGSVVVMFGRPGRVTAIEGGQYTVLMESPLYEPAGRGVNDLQLTHVYRWPRWRLIRGY